MENLFSRIGRTTIKVSVKVLAAVCAGILSVIGNADGSGKKGGN